MPTKLIEGVSDNDHHNKWKWTLILGFLSVSTPNCCSAKLGFLGFELVTKKMYVHKKKRILEEALEFTL